MTVAENVVLKKGFRTLIRVVPKSRLGDRLLSYFDFVIRHKRPPCDSLTFSDLLYRIKTSDEILDPLRVFVSDKEFVKLAYEQMKGQAELDVRGAMLLEKVAELENVEVTGDEIAQEIEKMAKYYRVTAEEVRASLTQQGGETSVADRLRSRKAVEKLVEKAKITESEWIDENQPQVEPEEKKSKKKAAKEEKSSDAKAKKSRKKSEE